MPTKLEAKQLGQIAILCDKYDCSKSFQLWSEKWLSNSCGAPFSDLGHLLLAAYKLNDPVHFADFSTQLIKGVVPKRETWDLFPELNLLPDPFKGFPLPPKERSRFVLLIPSDDVIQQAEATSEELQVAIEEKEGFLRDCRFGYAMDGKFCGNCWRRLPGNAKKCRPCNNFEFYPEWCSQELRIASYFAALRQAGLWPLSQALSKWSVRMLSDCLSEMSGTLRHSCAAGAGCPLKEEVENLAIGASQIQGRVRGLCLDCLRKNQFSSLTKSPGELNCRVRHSRYS